MKQQRQIYFGEFTQICLRFQTNTISFCVKSFQQKCGTRTVRIAKLFSNGGDAQRQRRQDHPRETPGGKRLMCFSRRALNLGIVGRNEESRKDLEEGAPGFVCYGIPVGSKEYAQPCHRPSLEVVPDGVWQAGLVE